MSYDYIPLSQSLSSGRSLEEGGEDRQTPRSRNGKRRAIFGIVLAIVLLALYFLAAELIDYAGELYEDDDQDAEFVHEAQSAYLPFKPPPQTELPPNQLSKLTPTQELPEHCRDAYFSSGALCYDPEIKPMDLLWTWVNGSDTLLDEAKLLAESRFTDTDPFRPKTSAAQARQYRDNDELRHSMRSALANFRLYTRKFHLLTSDFKLPEELSSGNSSYPEDWRLGQLPQWLDFSKSDWTDESIELNLIRHAEIFRPYLDTNFNSYAIESQFGHLENLTEHFIYLNDDFYMSNPLTPRTFYTSAYGTVLRMDLDIMVSPNKPAPDEEHGEWRSMGESNVLLSNRFGARYRPYVLHEAKAVSLSIIRELSAMWAPSMALAATHPFRETVSGRGDVSMLFLMVHFMIERWREALLWSWTVARNGGLGNEWDEMSMARAWAELGGEEGEKELLVKAGYRDTLADDRVKAYFKESGHRKPDKTWYQFSSWDGYPYTYMDGDNHHSWPSFRTNEKPESLPECRISYDECFMAGGEPFRFATDVFKHIAFRKPQCGDCTVQALVKASGLLGLETFLPPPHRDIPGTQISADDEEIPHLPLNATWEDVDFSIPSVMSSSRETNVRAWTLRLLQRYRFVVGYTPYAFVMLESMDNTRGALGWIDSYTDASLLCINDDVKEGEEAVSDYFRSWQNRRWGRHAAWERSH